MKILFLMLALSCVFVPQAMAGDGLSEGTSAAVIVTTSGAVAGGIAHLLGAKTLVVLGAVVGGAVAPVALFLGMVVILNSVMH